MANEVRLLLGAATDVGKVREVNEDSHGFVRCALGDLLVVCDGMGGHAAGDLASRTARDSILSHALTSRATDEKVLLREAIVAGHRAVRAIADASPDRAGMGTTVVAALVRSDWSWIANVGDSRCYLVRDSKSSLLSKDHTKGQRLLDGGVITAHQLETHPEKGVLTQALGQRADPEPEVTEPVRLRVEDALVLCSDGVYESMHSEIASVASAKNPNYAAHDLVIQAVERDGKDNATVVVGRYADLSAAAMPQALPVAAPATKPTARSRRGLWVAIPAVLLGIALGFFIGRGSAPEAVKTSAGPANVPPAGKRPGAVHNQPAPANRPPQDDEEKDPKADRAAERLNNAKRATEPVVPSPSPNAAGEKKARENNQPAKN